MKEKALTVTDEKLLEILQSPRYQYLCLDVCNHSGQDYNYLSVFNAVQSLACPLLGLPYGAHVLVEPCKDLSYHAMLYHVLAEPLSVRCITLHKYDQFSDMPGLDMQVKTLNIFGSLATATKELKPLSAHESHENARWLRHFGPVDITRSTALVFKNFYAGARWKLQFHIDVKKKS